MKAKLFAGSAAAALVLAGLGFGVRDSGSDKGVPFVDPLMLAKSICGGGAADAPMQRRAYFARIGGAIAKERPAATLTPSAPSQVATVSYDITTKIPAAQSEFNRGLAHLWNFNHGEAIVAFKAAQAADPACAMCYWAEAFAYGPNINAPMADEAVAPAFAAAKKAKERLSEATEKERALIDALLARYAPAPVRDRARLDGAFADAMDKVAARFPDDDFIAALAAEANMDTQPWDYWEADGRTPKGRAARALSLIEAILARNPDHQAAIHLYIHLTEATRDPYRAVPFAEKLAALSPGLGHLIHMPSHVYYRIGRFKEAIDLNVKAVAADEAFLAANKAEPMFEFGYYVHNVHFVMMSSMMAGDVATALTMAEKLDKKLPASMAAEVPFAQPIKAAPYYIWAQFGDPAKTLELADPGPDVPFLQAVRRYARGEAYARLGDAKAARAEAAEIGRIVAEEDLSPLAEIFIPATEILNIARLTVIARAAQAEGDLSTAIEAMEDAVALQDALTYTEPPYWYYPTKQTLAAMVLQKGHAERAEQLFIETLAESPNNGWALYGVSEAYRRQGDKNGEKYARALLKNAWAGENKSLNLARL